MSEFGMPGRFVCSSIDICSAPDARVHSFAFFCSLLDVFDTNLMSVQKLETGDFEALLKHRQKFNLRMV
jgi:hypothetical protein